ncbi:hypothetical protein BS47DRAFT_1393916 [Hydnum rufescens UP504]|uniref:Uncharacterized protein n=1 Tax=Hydnum rufescens UP504 TaxID=1448309 RepID=A0A9P6AVK4_9AGAM|nr:hypothetical protein BS47DRAFT_1393916 [Hydnum rufescens UP504]
MPKSPRNAKVAIIGSGLAGLTSAFLLSTVTDDAAGVQFDVHLFEKSDSVGMDNKSITVSSHSGGKATTQIRIDVPMRSFQGGYYPNLIALYNYLGVVFRTSDFSYSFSSLSSSALGSLTWRPRLLYNGSSGLGGISIPTERSPSSGLFACEDHSVPVSFAYSGIVRFIFITLPSLCLFGLFALQLLFNFIRLAILASPLFYSRSSVETLRQWSERTTPSGFLARLTGADVSWLTFIHEVVMPLFSAVCTASEEDVYNHPATEILEYVWKTHFTSHYVVTHGVQDAVSRIMKTLPPENIHLSSTIAALRLDPSDPSTTEITYTTADGTAVASGFHHVIFATQANNGIPILESYAASLPLKSPQLQHIVAQIGCLRRFKYIRTVVVNHTDDALIPPVAQDQRDLNLVCAQRDVRDYSSLYSNCVPPNYTMATHMIQSPPPSSSAFSSILPASHSSVIVSPNSVVYQTTNPIIPPRDECVLSTAIIERAVLTVDSKIAQRQLMTEEDAPSFPFGLSVSISRPAAPKRLLPFVVSLKRRRIRKLGPVQGAGRLQAVVPASCPSHSFSRLDRRKHDIWENDRDMPTNGEVQTAVVPPGIWLCGSYAHPAFRY